MNLFGCLLDGSTTSSATSSPISLIIMIVAMVAIFYFLLYRPQKKQEKAANELRNNLSVGDEITTIGGIIGEIVSIKDETVTIETSKAGTKIRILRSAIKSVDVSAAEKEKL